MNFSAASTKGTAEKKFDPIYQRKKTFKEWSFVMTKVLLFAALVACIAVPFRVFVKGEQTKHRYKTTLALNGVMFFGLMLFTGVMMFSGNAFAAETAETAAVAASSTATGLGYIAAALSIGMSCIGGGIAVASAASAALGAISEDSSILGKSLIFVGLAEVSACMV